MILVFTILRLYQSAFLSESHGPHSVIFSGGSKYHAALRILTFVELSRNLSLFTTRLENDPPSPSSRRNGGARVRAGLIWCTPCIALALISGLGYWHAVRVYSIVIDITVGLSTVKLMMVHNTTLLCLSGVIQNNEKCCDNPVGAVLALVV
jgi:hypothetical protein